MNKRQQLFVKEYLKDLNATQAAKRAGYSKKTAAFIGSENLKKPYIAEAIKKAMDERAGRVEISADRVLKELGCMGHFDPADLAGKVIRKPADICKLPENVRRAIVGWSWDARGRFTLKFADKTQALNLIGRHLKLFTDKVEHSGKVTLEDLLAEK